MLYYDTPDWLTAYTTGRGDEDKMPVPLEEMGLPRQTHTCHVEWMDAPGRPAETDAVITSKPGLCLGVKTADCIPVLVYDSRRRVVAAIHAGWRGTVGRIVAETLRLMESQPEDLHAIIGPGISQDWFEVGDEVYEAFLNAGFPMQRLARRYPCAQGGERWHVDLWDANRWVLEQCGVADIHIAGVCTRSTLDYYSARRETISTGRNLNCIMIKQ